MHEEDYFQDRKEGKKERKRISQKDRSKFKKTDLAKLQRFSQEKNFNKLETKDLVEGRVIEIFPEAILVFYSEEKYICTLKGSLKKERGRSRNLLVVGDFVLFHLASKAIHYIQPRKSLLSKQSPLHKKKEQLIASNIDQVLITSTLPYSALNLSLLDRYIIATCKGNMTPVVVINKIDLLNASEKKLLQATLDIYQALSIDAVAVSAISGEGMQDLQQIMKNKASAFAGISGVGKTSLINAVAQLDMKVGEVVEKTGRGKHTTTHATLVPLPLGGWCIDTPGIQKFGIWELKKEEVVAYFSDIAEVAIECKFPNCTHTHEPHCAVRDSVVEEKIPLLRFQAYLELLASLGA